MKKIIVETKRLIISSRSIEEMKKLYEEEPEGEIKQAYLEMIQEMKNSIIHEEWACDWKICIKDGKQIGGIGFKGLSNNMGKVEIGYGIDAAYQNQGYATEAVGGMLDWAFRQEGIESVQAQIEKWNIISKTVLLKNGFIEIGIGTEGILFEVRNKKR